MVTSEDVARRVREISDAYKQMVPDAPDITPHGLFGLLVRQHLELEQKCERLAKSLGHVSLSEPYFSGTVPPGMKCWKCGAGATVRYGDSCYCGGCAVQR